MNGALRSVGSEWEGGPQGFWWEGGGNRMEPGNWKGWGTEVEDDLGVGMWAPWRERLLSAVLGRLQRAWDRGAGETNWGAGQGHCGVRSREAMGVQEDIWGKARGCGRVSWTGLGLSGTFRSPGNGNFAQGEQQEWGCKVEGGVRQESIGEFRQSGGGQRDRTPLS